MIKVLWLSATSAYYDVDSKGYNGGGWVSSLLDLLETRKDTKTALAFLTTAPKCPKEIGNTSYYPIHAPAPTKFKKLLSYYGVYKRPKSSFQEEDIHTIIKEFKPDVIHLFGMENEMAEILGKTSVPIVVHLQGLLAPCDNAFWPIGFNKSNFIWPVSINEWVLKNGYIHAKNSIHIRANKEHELFHRLQYAMGRTEWDKQCTSIMAPQARYFHIDEVLRPIFYEHQGEWRYKDNTHIQIISTISNTVYKGLDFVLKTAQLLQKFCTIPVDWYLAGIKKEDKLIRFFEHKLGINSSNVHVHYLGILSAEELCQKELQASLYIHPSYIDNSPNSLCEAQLLGLPCIATCVGGIPSLIRHKEDGILVPTNAPYELAYYIKEIASNKDFATTLSIKGTQTAAARHNKEKIVEELMACYQTIIKQQS